MNDRSGAPGPRSAMRRPPRVAGSFYPEGPEALAREVERLLADAATAALRPPTDAIGRPPGPSPSGPPDPGIPARPSGPQLGALVPHAGLRYSGAVAALAWAGIGASADTILIAGTNHFVWLDGVGVWAGGAWETPIGDVEVDARWTAAILALGRPFVPAVREHAEEHSIEVQLPLVARACAGARIVPFLVSLGDCERTIEAGRRLGGLLGEAVARGERVVLVASSDLAHYPAERVARAVDERVLESLLALDARGLWRREEAIRADGLAGVACGMCGIEPAVFTVAALVAAGARRTTLLAHATSADAPGGDPGRVVGYASVAFFA